MTELGIGVRCYTAWVPDDYLSKDLSFNPRCRIAVIIDHYPPSIKTGEKRWWIRFEDDGEDCWAKEKLLYPIDDWNEDLTEKKESKQEEPA